jgi:hypothetical protein
VVAELGPDVDPSWLIIARSFLASAAPSDEGGAGCGEGAWGGVGNPKLSKARESALMDATAVKR